MWSRLGLVLGFLFLSGCQFSGPLIEGSGTYTTEVREVEGFTSIALYGFGDATLEIGNELRVEVETDENLQRFVRVHSDGETLELSLQTPGRQGIRTRRLRYRIVAPRIQGLDIFGSGSLESKNTVEGEKLDVGIFGSGNVKLDLKVDQLKVGIEGSGDAILSGHAKMQIVEIQGSGNYKALDLTSIETKVTIMGSGDVAVSAQKSLGVEVNGTGSVFYKGTPEVQKRVFGPGNVRSIQK